MKAQYEIRDGLIVDVLTNPPTCLGYLFDFGQDRGVFSPDGKAEFTKEQAEKHNQVLAQAEIEGLDKAKVGQWGTFYWSPKNGVTTWTGVHVADYQLNPSQTVLTFRRSNGHVFRGRTRKDADFFNFKRIA